MNRIVYVGIFILLLSCIGCGIKDINLRIPDCINGMISDSTITTFNSNLKTVQVQKVDNEHHYWLNTDARHSDRIEYIINSDCDTICSIGGGRGVKPANCLSDYSMEEWVIIWPT